MRLTISASTPFSWSAIFLETRTQGTLAAKHGPRSLETMIEENSWLMAEVALDIAGASAEVGGDQGQWKRLETARSKIERHREMDLGPSPRDL